MGGIPFGLRSRREPDVQPTRAVGTLIGHAKPNVTMDHYMSRRAVIERAALVL